MHKKLMEIHRDELILKWKVATQLFSEDFDHELYQVRKIVELASAGVPAELHIRSLLRQFHDKLGYKAKGTAQDGGLCAGAIFRTEAFINIPMRIGAKKAELPKNAHIEHTVPVSVIAEEIIKLPIRDPQEMLRWLLKNSVATAFEESQKEFLTGVNSSSDAFNVNSPDYDRPFRRYKKLLSSGEKIWNVFDRKPVDIDMTFENHFQIVKRLIAECRGMYSKHD